VKGNRVEAVSRVVCLGLGETMVVVVEVVVVVVEAEGVAK